ncbi:hypothetical protein BDA99DRAFT_519551 [Phascolomyces articulosus]|uniref:Uncharacterized protein n=1 Tax=Phascolomyces articulosus TaxID=60185 RepID=A0AAD5PAX5_9FUNG|nr:hypothetical protein BDA99DRAFT_519551 [Phascolomyces articulosus]
MLVHNHFHPSQQLRPRSAHSIYSANDRMMKLTFKKRLTQQLNRLLFPCHPDSDLYSSSPNTPSAVTSTPLPATSSGGDALLFTTATASSTSMAHSSSKTIQEEQPDQTDFFENDERAIIVHELNRLPSLKPPPRPAKRNNSANNKKAQATRSLESALSQSTLATIRTSHFDDMSELFFHHGRDDEDDMMSDTTSFDEEDDDQDMEEEEDLPRPQVALSVAILPSAVAAATAARSRRYQARVARATQV